MVNQKMAGVGHFSASAPPKALLPIPLTPERYTDLPTVSAAKASRNNAARPINS